MATDRSRLRSVRKLGYRFALAAVALGLQACSVLSTAASAVGTAGSVAASAASTGASVAGTAARTAASAVGSAVKAGANAVGSGSAAEGSKP